MIGTPPLPLPDKALEGASLVLGPLPAIDELRRLSHKPNSISLSVLGLGTGVPA